MSARDAELTAILASLFLHEEFAIKLAIGAALTTTKTWLMDTLTVKKKGLATGRKMLFVVSPLFIGCRCFKENRRKRTE